TQTARCVQRQVAPVSRPQTKGPPSLPPGFGQLPPREGTIPEIKVGRRDAVTDRSLPQLLPDVRIKVQDLLDRLNRDRRGVRRRVVSGGGYFGWVAAGSW